MQITMDRHYSIRRNRRSPRADRTFSADHLESYQIQFVILVNVESEINAIDRLH